MAKFLWWSVVVDFNTVLTLQNSLKTIFVYLSFSIAQQNLPKCQTVHHQFFTNFYKLFLLDFALFFNFSRCQSLSSSPHSHTPYTRKLDLLSPAQLDMGVASRKPAIEVEFLDSCWFRRQAREHFKVFISIIPSQSNNSNPKFCTWLELRGVQAPLAMWMTWGFASFTVL